MNRRRTATAPPSPPALLQGLELLTTTDQGELLLPGLSLSASGDGVTVVGPAGQVVREWSWSEITGLGADGSGVGTDGRAHQVLDFQIAGRSHRFLVSAPDLSPFLAATVAWRADAGLTEAASEPVPTQAPTRRTRRPASRPGGSVGCGGHGRATRERRG